MRLKDDVLRGVYSYGFERPSKVQATTIVRIAEGRDCVVTATSGTGKTAAYVVPMLQRVDTYAGIKEPQALVLVPTRSLALQVCYLVVSVVLCCGLLVYLVVNG